MVTANEQILWTQRILKEDAVNAKVNPDGFSLRSAVRILGVPADFKPNLADPTRKEAPPSFEPGGTLAKALRKELKAQLAGPRERHIWPETSYQEHGWLMSQPGRMRDRTAFSGTEPRAAIGWSWRAPGAGGEVEASVAMERELEGTVGGSTGSKAAFSRPRPPFAQISDEARKMIRESSLRAQGQRSVAGPLLSQASGPDEDQDPTRRLALTQPVPRSLSTPVLRGSGIARRGGSGACTPASSTSAVTPVEGIARGPAAARRRHLEEREATVTAAMDRSRHFLPKDAKGRMDKYFRPLGSSDVTEFANAYTKSANVGLYVRPRPPGVV